MSARLRGAFAVAASALVAACASDPGSVMVGEPNARPARYREEILAYLKTYLNDPTGVREAFITEPALRAIPGFGVGQGIGTRTVAVERYMVCLRFNAKNSLGRYEGSRDRFAVFLDGRFDTLAPARADICKDANWQPFPELEKLKR